MSQHDFISEEFRRERTMITRGRLTNYLVHGVVSDLEIVIEELQAELEMRREEVRTGMSTRG